MPVAFLSEEDAKNRREDTKSESMKFLRIDEKIRKNENGKWQ
jgi:hypothetical protein